MLSMLHNFCFEVSDHRWAENGRNVHSQLEQKLIFFQRWLILLNTCKNDIDDEIRRRDVKCMENSRLERMHNHNELSIF